MNIVSIGVLAVVAVIVALTLRPKNAEIALMLTVACAVLILLAVLSQAGQIIGTVNSIVAAAQINTGYIAILLKVVGICLLTEFAVSCGNAARYSSRSLFAESARFARISASPSCRSLWLPMSVP